MSTRSIKTLISTVIDNEVYDSNRIARLIDNLELYQNKVDNLLNDISSIPQSLADVSAIQMELEDLSTNVAEIDARVNQHDIDISSIYLSIDDINSQLDALPTDFTTIVSSINTLQIDVSALQIDVSGIQGNLTKAEADILDLSYQISLLPTDVTSIVTAVNDLSKNVYVLDSSNVKTSGTQTIAGNKTFSGITQFTNVAPALSATSASVMVSGGIGISGNAYVNNSLYVSGNTQHLGDIYVRGNITQNDNNSAIVQSGTGTNILKNTTINALTVTTINGITNSKLQYVNSTAVYDLVVQGGITPDSIQEITQTLQSTITLAYNAGYRHFYLPKGTYIVRDITLGQGVVFYGDGRETILKIPNSSSIIFPQQQCAVFSLNQANITIKDITIDGNHTNVSFSGNSSDYQYEGIALDTGANYTTIENVYMINTYNDGLDMDNVNNCIVRNSWFINCGGHGIHLNGEGAAGYNCVNNIIDNCIIENCGLISILGATFSGIHCNSQAGHNTISNITIINCAYGGITNSGTNNSWTNIIVRNNTTTGKGIFIASTALCTNIDSVILQGGAIGIDCQGNRSTISSIQMDTIATTGITISGSGNTLNNLSLNSVSGSPLLISGNNTIIDDMYINGVAVAIDIQGTNSILTNFAIRSATKKIQVGASRSSFANFHWIDSDATITDSYVLSFASGASYNSIVNMSYSGNRSVHFESSTTCLYNRFINGYIASGFTANVLATTNNTYILGVNTSSSVINLIRGNAELGSNDSIKQSGTGIIDQSGNGTNIMKSTLINGNLQIKTNDTGLRLVSADAVNGTNGQILMKADANDNEFNRLVDARDSVIYSTKGTMNSGVLTLTTESNVGDVGIRITPENMYIRAPLNIELSGNVYLNGERLLAFGDVTADLLQLQTDVSLLQTDVSFLQTDVSSIKLDISNIIADISNVKIDISAVEFDISSLKLTDLQNVKITGNQDISGVKSFTSVLNVKNTTNSGNTSSGALVVSGGMGVSLDSNFGGNISLSSGNINQSSGGVIRQSGTGTNVFKTTEMAGALDMSYQSIIDVSAIIGTGANIMIQPNNNVVIKGDRDITFAPRQPVNAQSTTKSGMLLLNSQNAPYSAGLVLEETTDGNILSYGINVPQVGTRVNSIAGGIFRFDTRGTNQLFQIVMYKEGATTAQPSFPLTINSDGNVRMNATSSSTNTTTGALVVSGGVGIGENLYVNSLLRVNSTTNSTSAATGAVVVSGGIGIGGNTNIGGNILINSTLGATNTTTGALQVRGGAGIAENVYVGGIGVINSTTDNTGANSGAFRVAGGASIGANTYIGGNLFINSTFGATNTSSGALQVKGGVGIAENVYIGGIGVINSTTENTGANSGAFRVAGGASIGGNAYIGGNATIQSTTSATSTSNGALQVKGGAGIAANLYIGGQTFVKNNSASIGNSSAGALQVDGGVGVGGNIFVNNIIRTGELVHNKKIVVLDASMGEDPSGATKFYGFGVNTDTLRYQTPTIDSVHRFYSGTEPGLLSAGKLSLTTNIESTNTDTGTLRVAGGVGILGDVNIGGNINIGVAGNIQQTLRVNSANNLDNKLVVLHTTNPSSATDFFGFGVNTDALRYQTSATDKVHRFYSGTDAGILHAGKLDLSSNIESNSITTGTLRISGGAGISGNLYVGGNHILLSQTDATSISTGAFQVLGGVGISKNMYVGGQTVIGNALPSLGNSATGALQVSGGVGVGGNVFVDNMIRMKDNKFNKKLVLLDASVNESPNNAKLFYGFGVNTDALRYQTDATGAVHRFYSGENDGAIVAGNIVLLGENTSLDASSGALVIVGGVGIGANLNVRGITVIEDTRPAVSTTSAALVVNGGTSIAGDIIVGGNLLISGATSFTGADISGVTTFRNDSQSFDPSGGAVIIYGGLGVGKDINVRGNMIVSDTGNLSLLGNSTILQNASTLGVNSLKATKMSGNLDLSFNHIINASSLTTNGNISISSTNKVVFQGNDAISIYTYVPPNAPTTTKNALYINEPAKSGIAGETDSGNSLIIGINTSHLGQRDNSLQGVIAKFDSRVGQPLFSIETAAGGQTNTFQALAIDGSYNTTISGNTRISATTDSVSTESGALRVSGGAGIAANLYVGGNIVITNETNSSSTNTGSLQVAGGVGIGGNVYIKGATVITDTTSTTNTTEGALRVSGGISIGGNVYAENLLRIANANNNKKVVLQDLNVNETPASATEFFGFGVNPDSLRYQTGNTGAFHKFYSGTNDGILHAGNLTLTQNSAAINTTSGALIVGGGAGIAGNVYVGGLLYNVNNTESISVSTGAGVFTGGVGVGGNVSVGGNAVIGANIIQSANGSTIRQSGTGTNVFKATEMAGTLDMSYQSIIDVSAIVGAGANIVIQPNDNVRIRAGRDITLLPEISPKILLMNYRSGDPYSAGLVLEETPDGNILSYGINIPQFGSNNQREIARAGGLFRFDTRGGVNQLFQILTYKEGANLETTQALTINSNGNVRISTTSSSTTTNTGALVVSGGVGIGENLYVNSLARVNSTTNSTSVGTGAFVVSGGIGVGGNANIGGNMNVSGTTRITNSTQATSTTTGAFSISGGASMGGNVYVGGNLVLNGAINSSSSATGTLIVTGGVGISQNMYVGGSINQDNSNYIQTGIGIISQSGSGQNTLKQTYISSDVAATSTTTGALTVVGGVGIGGNVLAAKAFIGTIQRKEFDVDINGNVSIGDSVTTYPTFDSNYLRRTLNIMDTNASLKIARFNASSVPVLELENYNATTLLNAWRMEAGSQLQFKYTAGVTPATSTEVFRIDSTYAQVLPTTESTSVGTGALRVSGGASVSGNLFVGGNISLTGQNILQTTSSIISQSGAGTNTMKAINITDTTDSMGATVGALRVSGGAGILGNVVLGNTLGISSTIAVVESTTTGALRVAGGATIAGNAYVAGIHRMGGADNNKKIVLSDGDTTESATSGTNFYGFGKNTNTLRYQAPSSATHKFFTGSSSGNVEMGQLTLTSATTSTTSNTGALVVSGGVGIGGNINVVGNVSVGTGKQVLITTDTMDNVPNTLVDVNDSVVAGVDESTQNTGVLTLTTRSNQGDVGIRITNQNITVKAPTDVDVAALMRVQKLSENFTLATIASNTVTVDFSTTNSAYYMVPSTSTNLSFVIQNVPTSKTYSSYTLTFAIDTSTYKVYGNSVNVNGNAVVLKYGLGSAHTSVNDINFLVQQVVIFFTTSTTPNAVLTSVTGYS